MRPEILEIGGSLPNGAQALISTLVSSGVTTCFTNPGTSEMHFVAALDAVPEMRGVLALFEGVATGAADGYARMAGKPAATLLHLGPGLGNGLANLHNARRARIPMVNVVGDHATYHRQYDAQLQSDIETVARNVSSWIRTSSSTAELAGDADEAVATAIGPPAQVATLILPADVSWSEGAEAAAPIPVTAPAVAGPDRVDAVAAALRQEGGRSAILLGGRALREPGLLAAARVASATGAKLLVEVFPTRLERGAGLPAPERLAYVPELASVQLAGLRHLVLADAKAPVSFFAYPGKKSYLVPEGCDVHELTTANEDVVGTLDGLVEAVGAGAATPSLQEPVVPGPPSGTLTAESVCQAIGAVLPEGAIISDEAQTSGVTLAASTIGAPRHDLLALTGGAIGQGLPAAVGAAIACPERPVLALEADGSAMYTIQALWTMAREQLNVTALIFNNRSYGILNVELARVGARAAGPKAESQLDLSAPDIDFAELSKGLGVPSSRVDTGEDLVDALRRAIAEDGPHLIEVVIPTVFSARQLRAMPYALNALEKLPRPMAGALKRRLFP
jgi:acetolactate synthase I/II/III large subunit